MQESPVQGQMESVDLFGWGWWVLVLVLLLVAVVSARQYSEVAVVFVFDAVLEKAALQLSTKATTPRQFQISRSRQRSNHVPVV